MKYLREPPQESEDCLRLNIFRRFIPKSYNYVWIHGGALRFESGDNYLPDGILERKILVTINYRLGELGFAHPSINDSEEFKTNFGLLDQIKALHWVRENIENFVIHPISQYSGNLLEDFQLPHF